MNRWRAAVRVNLDGTIHSVKSKLDAYITDDKWAEIVATYDGYTFKEGSWFYIQVVEDDDGNMVAT